MNDLKSTGIFELRLSDNRHEIAYLRLPTYPKQGVKEVSKSIRLFDLIGDYKGPDIVLDFDQNEVLTGIEIISDNYNEEEE